MKYAHLLVLLMLISAVSFADCAGEATIGVPAVISDSGGIVPLTVKLIPGNGNVYLTTVPRTGVSLQQSADDAVHYAFASTGRDIGKCDILIIIGEKGSESYVDGPSAGAAMSVVTIAAIENKTPRTDAVLTGTVDTLGNVGPVGGLFEKALGSLRSGKTYFVNPVDRVSDRMMLEQLKERYGLVILQVETVDEAAGFMLDGENISDKGLKALERPLPNVTAYSPRGLDRFAEITRNMITIENRSVAALPEATSDDRNIKDYFNAEIARQFFVMDKGYLFTAANDAFLNYIDAGTIANVKTLDVDGKKAEVETCLDGLGKSAKTSGNFEYLVGADLRKSWAMNKIANPTIAKPQLAEEKYIVFNELMYADAWCRIAGELENVNASGAPMNESRLKELASARISAAETADGQPSPDTTDHLNSAKKLFDEGKYAAAIYDATFATVMRNSETGPPSDLDAKIAEASSQQRSSLWGEIYQTQAMFLTQGASGDRATAYQLFVYSSALDNATAEMKALAFENTTIVPGPEPGQGDKKPWPGELSPELFFGGASLAILAIALLAAAALLFPAKKSGNVPRGAKTRKK
jgi:hypothetical protein